MPALPELVSNLALLDASGIFSSKTLSDTERDLIQAGMRFPAKTYISFSLTFSALVSFVASLIFLYFSSDILQSFAFLFLFFSISFLILSKYPAYEKRKRAERIESEFSMALREMVAEIEMGLSFEKSFSAIGRGSYGELSREFRRANAEIESYGASVSEALRGVAERVDSVLVKRICMQLIFSYERGLKGEGLRELANSLVSLQKTKSREFSAKFSFLGILFMSVSCIVPAIFAAYVIIGSSFLSFSFSSQDILTAYALVFPICDLAILLYLREKAPQMMIS